VRVAAPILAVLVAAWTPSQTRTPFSAAVSVSEAIETPGFPQIVCGKITAARSASEEFGTILRLSDTDRNVDLLVTIGNNDRDRFDRRLETHLIDRLVCLSAVVVAMPGGPVIELSDPDRFLFVSAPPAPDDTFLDGVERTPATSLPEPTEPRNPIYAPRARAALVQGESEVLVRIDRYGNVEAARILEPLDPVLGLDGQALNAAFLWKFRPALRDGLGVPSVATIVLGFDLGVERGPRRNLILQRAGQDQVDVVQTSLAADDPFVAGASVAADVLPTPWWVEVPPYSFAGLKAGIEGAVGLDVVVGADGRVARARVAESLAGGAHGLDEAALEEVRGWRFTPGVVAGQPAAAAIRVTVRYGLQLPTDPR